MATTPQDPSHQDPSPQDPSPQGPSRRKLLAGLALYGAAAPLAMNLSAIGKAAAQAAGPGAPYRALVCIFLTGGNDSNNLLLATDPGSWSQYWTARNSGTDPIALMPPGTAPVPIGGTSAVTGRTVKTADQPEHWGGVLPIVPKTAQAVPPANQAASGGQGPRTFALHPMLSAAQGLFNAGKVAAIANVGTLLAPLTKAQYQHPTSTTQIPQRLFSHADQQAAWQSGQLDGSATGWGGLMADTFQAAQAGGDFASITTAGNTPFPQGAQTDGFRINFSGNKALAQTISLAAASGTYNESPLFLAEFRANLQDGASSNQLVQTYATAVARSMQTATTFDAALTPAYAAVPTPPAFTDPIAGKTADNPLADQLEAVVQTAAAHAALGVSRQVFFVQYGSFDTHDGENPRQGLLLAQLDQALAYLDQALTAAGLANAVTAFTASDFNRTFTTNGDGTDHAWGGHHLVYGGAVKGGDIYGAYPTLGVDNGAFQNPDGVGTALVPTTSVETYLATMARWMGVTSAQMAGVFPRLANFPVQDLGFMSA